MNFVLCLEVKLCCWNLASQSTKDNGVKSYFVSKHDSNFSINKSKLGIKKINVHIRKKIFQIPAAKFLFSYNILSITPASVTRYAN